MVERPGLAAEVSVVAADRSRPALSRELIAQVAMRLALEQPFAPLTLARLGAELGADPTAVYRHFRSSDELLLELVDRAFGEALRVPDAGESWQDSLVAATTALRAAVLKRPALAAQVGSRFTGGPNEQRGIEMIREIFGRAGFENDEATLHVRAFGEMILAHITLTASAMAQGEAAHRADMALAERVYGAPPETSLAEYEEATFAVMLRVYIAGLEALLAGATNDDIGS